MYTYRIYGLRVGSELELESCEVIEASSNDVDLTIAYGAMPEIEGRRVVETYWVSEDMQSVILRIEGLVDFYIHQGCEILIQRHLETYMDNVKHYLLGYVLSVIMLQRQRLLLHGAVVSGPGGCIAIIGKSGAGKTTLTSAFVQAGYDFLSDDVVVCHREDQVTYAIPTLPTRRLWQDGLSHFREKDNVLRQVPFGVDKYIIKDLAHYRNTQVALSGIVELVPSGKHGEVHLEVVDPIMKSPLLYRHLYLSAVVKACGLSQGVMGQLGSYLQSVPYYRLVRPAQGMSVSEQMEMILRHLSQEA